MAIDIYTHVVPFDFPPGAGSAAPDRWPQMASTSNCRHRNVMIDGKVFRTVTDECWDVARRLEHMASIGITRQVLSPMPELLSYWLPAGDAVTLCRHVNDTIVAMVEQAPEKFAALGCVPLQDVDLPVGGDTDEALAGLYPVITRMREEPGSTQRTRFRTRRADGEIRWVEIALTNLLADPAVAGIVVATTGGAKPLTEMPFTFQGMGLGGNSAFNGMLFQTNPPALFDRHWPSGWHWNDMRPHFDRVREHVLPVAGAVLQAA